MRTFYLSFGVDCALRNVYLRVQAAYRQTAIVRGKSLSPFFCEAYAWDLATAAEKAARHGCVIADGGVME